MNLLKIITLTLITQLLIISFYGCGSWGGGGGVYYPPEVSVNKIDLIKKPFPKREKLDYKKLTFPDYYSDSYERFCQEIDVSGRLSEKYFSSSSSAYKFTFIGSKYLLNINSNYVNIYHLNDDNKLGAKVKELRLPRYGTIARILEINLSNEPYLVLYIDQQSTSHSSTFFILNKKFDIIYEEHLLGAICIGYGESDKYGDFIVVNSENFWFPNGVDESQVNINGDWLYYLSNNSDNAKH